MDFNDYASYQNPDLLTTYTTGIGWTGIPNYIRASNNIRFSGIFNGNNHIIKNLYMAGVSGPTTTLSFQERGFFSAGSNCTIKNLGLVNVNISNISYGAGLINKLELSSVIDNCFVTGKLFGVKNNGIYVSSDPLGGLCCSMDKNSKISNCYTNVQFGSLYGVGGLVGFINGNGNGNGNVSIKNCYTTGNLEVLNSVNYGLLVGIADFSNGTVQDSIINCYSNVNPIKIIPTGRTAAKLIGNIQYYNSSILSIIIKGCFGLSKDLPYINYNPAHNISFSVSDTVFTGSPNPTFTALTTPAYSNTYLYDAANQQFPLLYKTDSTLLGGQRAVYPSSIEKKLGINNRFGDSIKPVDNFTKNGNTTFTIHNINGLTNGVFFTYFSINSSNGTLKWVEEIPTGEYLVEIRGVNGTENSQSWVLISIIRGNNSLVNANAQSVQFKTKDSTQNGDYILIDYLNLINKNYTIETWAKMESNIGSGKRIFDFGTGANTNGVLLGFQSATQFVLHSNSADNLIDIPAGFNAYQWNHYAVTLQNDSLKLYLNGTLIGAVLGATPTIGFNKNYIGRSNFTGDSCTAGRFSDFRIWLNAHTASQINGLNNKKIPTNADSLYVYLPLNFNIYREYTILANRFSNAAENNFGQIPNVYFNINNNNSVSYIYDSSFQFIYGTLNTFLRPGEIIQIALKDTQTWYDVTNVHDYFFSYKLPTDFLSGTVYVRTIIAGANTYRFGNNYTTSKYVVDWAGTNLRLNPNMTFKTIYPNTTAVFMQRNQSNNPNSILNPLLANTTDGIQKAQFYSLNPYFLYSSTSTLRSRLKTNNYGDGIVQLYKYTPQSNSIIALNTLNQPVPARNMDIGLVNTNGNDILTFNNQAPSGLYEFNLQLNNSANVPNIGLNEAGNYVSYKNFRVIFADSLKAVHYAANHVVNAAFKNVQSGNPVIIGNDGTVQAIRYQIIARRNGIDITNVYTINESNLSLNTTNRPIGVDSVFLTFTGWFNEEVKDTLTFGFEYTKPSVKYSPNVSNDFSLVNGNAQFYPLVLDSGGQTLTYSLITPNAHFTLNSQTGKITVLNWESLAAGYTDTLRIEASNGIYMDTTTFTYTKNAQNRVLYYSNSSYRTQSTTGEDYIQLPSIDLRNKAFGLDIWYKHNAQTGSWHRIFEIGRGANNQGVLLGFPDFTHLFVRTPNQSDYAISIPAGVNIRNWNHYMISVSNAGVASFFINGKLIFSRAGGGTTPQHIFTINYLGKSAYGGGDAPSVGQFTDFRIWDNAIDSTVYNTRGITYFTTTTGANLIYYLPLSLPVFNSNVPLPNNYPLLNKATISSTAILDSISYIKGSSNSFNFDADRIFLAGQSSFAGATKTITLTTNNYASETDTNTNTAVKTVATINNKYYWGGILPPSQGVYLNNQIIGIKDSLNADTNVNYNYIVKYLPNNITYLPGDTVKVFTGQAGVVLPRNDYWVADQKPTKYTWLDNGGINNIINLQLDTVTGRFSWLPTQTNEGVYPIKLNVTNAVGTIAINCQVLLSDSLGTIQYQLDSLSVNFGSDSTNIPFLDGITPSTRFSVTSIPNNGDIRINSLNGRIYWTSNVPIGLYTLKVEASNYINTVTKTIKLNIQALVPSGFAYQTKNYTILNTGFDTATTYINKPIVNAGGDVVVFTANMPTGCQIDSNTGAIHCKNNLVNAGNYTVIIKAQNVAGFVYDSIFIYVTTTSKDSILGYKNAYFTLNTDTTYKNGDFIALPTINLPNDFSIEAWVKLNNIRRNYQQIFEAGNANNNHLVSIGTQGTTGRLFITVPTTTSGTGFSDIGDPEVTPRIANNTWFHIVYVKRGTNVKLYLNGSQIMQTNAAVSSYNAPITQVYFGATNFTTNKSMLGQLDECRIWKKALSESEINQYKNVFLTPQDDSLYVYLPLHGSLLNDTNIANGTVIKNSATGALALTGNILVVGNRMKMSRDSNRQIVYGTHDTTTTLTNTIGVKTHFFGQPVENDSNTTAVKHGSFWATENNKIPTNFSNGTLVVSKGIIDSFFNPNPFYVYFPPTNLTYNITTYNITQSTTPFTTNKPIVNNNYDSNNLVYSILPAYTGMYIDHTTGIIRINSDTLFKLYGKQIKATVTAQTGLGKTSTTLTFNIINTNIIGFNNTSVCLPNTNGSDYIRIPSLDLRNSNFAIDIWFKLIGNPVNNKRIFDFSRGAGIQGLILYFPANQLKLGAFAQDGLINLGNADTVLKNGLNEWNKYSIFYNAATKTYYVYINGVFKQMATVATDNFTSPLMSNFLAKNNFTDPITDGYFREFKVYKNLSYTDFINNLPYNLLPNRTDSSLYYYLPLSNNFNNYTYIGNININNDTTLTNKAVLYNPNAPNNNAIITSANKRAFYYGDTVNQIITGEFADQADRIRFSYTNGVIQDTILPNVAADNYSWQIRGKNMYGKFKVYSSLTPQYADSINVLIIPSKLNYATNNRLYPIIAGNSGNPTFDGTDIRFSIDSGNTTGFVINANTGVINWGNTIRTGLTKLRVLASNQAGYIHFTYIVNFQDTLQGFRYFPDTIQASGFNTDSVPYLPSFTKGTGAVFSILNPITGFSIDINTGRVYWTNTVANGLYRIGVRANNLYNVPVTYTLFIYLINQAPSNLKYVQDTMVYNQGVHVQTPTPSINKGGLPTLFAINNISPSGNFSIDSLTGAIKWTSNTLGTYTITVVATNSLGAVSKTIHITILSAANIALDYNNAALFLGVINAGNINRNRVELPSLDLRGGYTIEAWAKVLNVAGVGNWRRIFDFGTGQNYEGVVLGFQSATTLGLHASTGEDYIFNFPLNFNALNWNHYALTVSDSVRLYVNGVLLGTARANKPSVIFNKNYLNYSNFVSDEASVNAYQECRIWKYARNADEIAQNYQGSIPNDAIGLYYYLPFKQTGYLPGSIINPTNFVLAPEAGLFMGNPYYTSKIANVAVKLTISDSSKIWAVVPNSVIPNTNQGIVLIPYYKIDSTRQKIAGNYADTIAAGEQLQYSIDTGNTWKNIDFVQGNNWSQTIDTGFKFGLIKIRSTINNEVTNRVFNDLNVVVYPNAPTNILATPKNDGTVTLQFTPPVVNAAITGYKIYTSAGVLVGTTVQSPALIEGLNNGQSYRFQVSSINSKGESVLSALSNAVTVVNNVLQITTFTNNVAGVNITPGSIVDAYSNFRVTYQANTGYKIDSIFINNVRNTDSTAGFTFSNISRSHSVKVYASKIQYTISITKNSGGVVTPNQSTIIVNYGDTLTIQIIPYNRYRIDSVFINGVYNTTINSYTFTNIQKNNTVRVVFKEILYKTMTIEIVGNGTASATGIIEVEQGTTYRLAYKADIGNLLDSVLINDILVQDSTSGYTFTNIQNDIKIRLIFKIKTYTITAFIQNGTVTPSGTKTYNYGTQVNYNFTPTDSRYVLDSLLIDGVLQFNPDTTTYSFNVDANYEIKIIFNLKANVKYTVYINKTEGVTVTPSTNQQVGYGGNLRVTWIGNTGYVLDSIIVNKVNIRDSINGYTFNNIRGHQSINIKYKIKTYTITSSAGIRGSINPLGISVVNYGSNKSFVLLPNVGFETDSLIINGTSVSKPTDNIYTFNNVTANHTIRVTFKIATIIPNPCTGTKQTPNIVRVTDALKSDITSFATQRWYLAGTIKDSTTNNTYTPTDAGVYTLLGVDATGCESNISKKYYYAKTCITPAGRLGNGASIQTDIVGNANIMIIKWCTELIQGDVSVQVVDINGELIEDKKIPANFGTYILNKQQIQSKKYIIKVIDNKGELIQISDVVNNF
ncbi:MAG: hypothetical protein ORN58_00740 [Sediminibacterium sp.]|nr:hypothetical protein [Sediminibacterium sp.]